MSVSTGRPADPEVLPFGPRSRTGFELELLAPKGKSRLSLTRAVARRLGGRVQYGFKYYSEGRAPDGRPVCLLSSACRAVDSRGVPFATFVDDNTIRDDLDARSPGSSGHRRVVMDDLRLATWLEDRSWTDQPAWRVRLKPLLQTFDATLGAPGDWGAQGVHDCVVKDRWGSTLAVVTPERGERERVCEVVTRPLQRTERLKALLLLFEEAQALDFRVPAEGAMHLHLDRAPWMSASRLATLVRRYSADREQLLRELMPNPRCRKLGPFSLQVQQVAEALVPPMSFEVFATALDLAGVSRELDINLLGVIRRWPRHPTLEVRCLPVHLELPRTQALLEQVEAYLLDVAQAADAAAR